MKPPRHYDGVCFDLESFDGSFDVERFKKSLALTKKEGLIVMVTTSWFNSPSFGHPKWMNTFIIDVGTKKEFVDLLSPQLYQNDCDTEDPPAVPHPWNGEYAWKNNTAITTKAQEAYITATNIVVPSINDCVSDCPNNINNIKKIKEAWKLALPGRSWQGYIQFCKNYYGGDRQNC